ncbi:MAG TPA: S9 family peptidase [Candidatus Acidoferrales bacterium]|nr:S9 family peptidase [Candidatus Acidoferrales bacterium]
MTRGAFHAVAALLLSLTASAAQAPRPLTAQDLYRLKSVNDPQLTPDGKLVAYVVTTIDAKEGRRVSRLWIVPADGSGEEKPLLADVPARSPRWSPDGRWLAFLSAGPGPQADGAAPAGRPSAKPQVWVAARDGSARRQITNFPQGVLDYSWSPDGTRLAVEARPGLAAGPERDVRDYTSLVYKLDGYGWYEPGSQSHIWLVNVSDGAARQLTFGAARDDSDPEWSPNGEWIAYVSQDVGPALRDFTDSSAICILPAAGGTPRAVLDRHTNVSSPRWSPDSKTLAYAAAPAPSDQPLLTLSSISGAQKPVLASAIDRFPTQVVWDRSGRLWFGAADRGAAVYYRVDVATHRGVRVLAGDRAIHELQVSDSGNRLVYLVNDATHPPEVFSAALDGTGERQLTWQNRDWMARVQTAPIDAVTWKSAADGLAIQGFFARPLTWQPGRKYPMILDIHGGPNGMWGFHWSFDAQLYAANGYAVLMANPRGSSGYGMKFQRAVAGEWGGSAYQDLITGVAAMLARYPWIDRTRLGVVGHSYGGFMTDWIVGHTRMFKAAISIAGISDFVSDEGIRDAAFAHSRDFGGDLFSQFDAYWKTSPIRYAASVKTPILFLHGEADNRVPPSQSEEYFRAIKHFGGTAELVFFPGESHMLPVSARPRHLVETYQWRLYWFDRYVKEDPEAVAPDAPGQQPANGGRPSRN